MLRRWIVKCASSPHRALLPCVLVTVGLLGACERRIEPIAAGSAAAAAVPTSGTRGTAASATAGQSTAAAPSTKPISAADVDFVATVASGNSLEVEASKLALERSRNEAVRKFAQHMVADHGKVGQELRALPISASVGNFAALIPKHKDQLNKLRELDGAAFDKAYATQIGVAAHQETVSLFQKAADGASDSQTKAFAQAKLPALREHLALAQTMARQVGSAATPAKTATQGDSGTGSVKPAK
jgi:putative membrane protein